MTLKWRYPEHDSLGGQIRIIDPPTQFESFRGEYIELWNKKLYDQFGVSFVEDDISVSRKNVLTGIHGDRKTWKLVSCLYGAFYLVVVNNDKLSPFYHRWLGITLSDRNRLQVLIPPYHGNGHLVLTETSIFHYKQSEYYDREGQFTLCWDDPDLGIYWPIQDPILSERDAGL